MKRHLAPALFSLSLCAVMGGVRTAGAQTLNEIAPTTIDSTSPAGTALTEPSSARPVREPRMTAGPVILAPTPLLLSEPQLEAALPTIAPAAAAVEWKMPTSRALIIGGTATALVGLFAVGHDTGAIIALSGTAVAVYGLYLHYNR